MYIVIRWKTKIIPHCCNNSKIKSQIVERDKIDTSNTQTRDFPLSWVGTDTSIQIGGVKPALLA